MSSKLTSSFHGDRYGHNRRSIEDINRTFDYHYPPGSDSTRTPANSPHFEDFYQRDAHRKQKLHFEMISFNGPWSKDLESFNKSVRSMPEQYKSSFTSGSKATLDKICDPSILHVWESDTDLDNLLQLTSVIAKLGDLGVRKNKDIKVKLEDGSMLIIAEEDSNRDNYKKICELVRYLTEKKGRKHLDDTARAFGKIVVVRGWNNSIDPAGTGNKDAAEQVVERIDIAIKRVLRKGEFEGSKKKIVWHHGPSMRFLLHWIETTTGPLRSALSTITIAGSMDLTNGVVPSHAGRGNKLADLERLESYAKRLNIPVVFLDPASQLITHEYLGTYMYFFAYYLNTLLPHFLTRPHLGIAQDELVTFAFQLRGVSENKYGSDVVRMVKEHLDAGKAKYWARKCVSTSSYEKSTCRAAGRDAAIHHAVQLADSPFALFNHGRSLPAFARLAVGPASPTPHEYHVAAPVHINFKQGQLRPSNPATFHIIIPTETQTVNLATERIQGLMMAVLSRVYQEKGFPTHGEPERGMWKEVMKACSWAINGCEGKMPKDVSEKVKYVKKKMREGTWGHTLGAAKGRAKAAAADTHAAPMAEPNRTYGYGQGYGAGQTMGLYEYDAEGQQQQGMGIGMGMDPAIYAHGQGYHYGQAPHVPVQGYAQQQMAGGYAVRPQSRAEAYPQSMGGPW